jgi:formate-dependent nitrite reductase membrane component NrfD
MSWGSWILLLVYPIALLQGFGGLDDDDRVKVLSWRPVTWIRPLFLWALARADAMRPWVLRGAIGVGLGLGLYTGILLGALAARPQWSSALMGPLFLTSGMSTGIAFLLLFPIHGTERRALTRLDVAAIGLELALIAMLLVGFATGDGSAQHAFWQLTAGPWASAFWSLVVVAGLAVPLAMEALELRLHLPFIRLAPALVLVGGLALRFVLMLSGQASGYRELP